MIPVINDFIKKWWNLKKKKFKVKHLYWNCTENDAVLVGIFFMVYMYMLFALSKFRAFIFLPIDKLFIES